MVGDPVRAGCRKPGDCFTDSDCPATAACIDNRCRNPCDSPTACGVNAECTTLGHAPQCRCPAKTRGDAKVTYKLKLNKHIIYEFNWKKLFIIDYNFHKNKIL